MANCLVIEINWFDEHLVELSLKARNGIFSGQTKLFANHSELNEMGDKLSGFPVPSEFETATFNLGTFDPAYTGGGASFTMKVIDSSGHIEVEVKLLSNSEESKGMVSLTTFVEPAAIDIFCDQLKRIKLENGNSATLTFVT